MTPTGQERKQPRPFLSPRTASAPQIHNQSFVKLPFLSPAWRKPEADGSHRTFWPDLHSDCSQIQNLENFPLYLLRESRESKSPPRDISLVMRPFKIPEQRKGTGEQKDSQDKGESLATPILSGPHSPNLPPGSSTMSSP